MVFTSFSISSTCHWGKGLGEPGGANSHMYLSRLAPQPTTAPDPTHLCLCLAVADAAQRANVVAGGVHGVHIPGVHRHHQALVSQVLGLRGAQKVLT